MAYQIGHINTWNTLLYAKTRDVFNLNKSFTEDVIKGKDAYVKGGYVEKEIGYYTPERLDSLEIFLNKKQLSYF